MCSLYQARGPHSDLFSSVDNKLLFARFPEENCSFDCAGRCKTNLGVYCAQRGQYTDGNLCLKRFEELILLCGEYFFIGLL